MADILYVVVTVAFFALAAGFVRVCDHIIGPDPTAGRRRRRPGPADRGRRHRSRRGGGGEVTADNVLGLVIAVLILGYLVVTLVYPEKF